MRVVEEEIRRLRPVGAYAANAFRRQTALEVVCLAVGEGRLECARKRFVVAARERVVRDFQPKLRRQNLPFALVRHHQEDPAVAAAVEAVQRAQAVALGVHRRALGLAGVGQEVVPVGVGVGAEHVHEDLLPVAKRAAGGEAEQGGRGHHHRRVRVRVHFVGAQQLARRLAQLVDGLRGV